MGPLDVTEQQYEDIVQQAQEVLAKSKLKLESVVVYSQEQAVIDAVIAIFGDGPVNNGKVAITYDMYCSVLELIRTTGAYKVEEYI